MDRNVAPLTDVPSTSKLRRLRAALAKRKMYDYVHKDDYLHTMTSQVAMLTTSIDTLVSLWNSRQYVPNDACTWQSSLNPLASEFTPRDGYGFQSGRQTSEASPTSSSYFQQLQDSMADARFCTEFAQLVGQWEPMEECSESQTMPGQVDLEAVAAIDCSRHADASVQTEMLSAGTSAEQPPDRGACCISGGPLSLDSVLVYTKEEIGTICDALVEPLANAIHSLDDIDSLLSCSSSVADAEVSLGTLLRDICSKFVPLTVALDAKRQAAEQFRARHAGRMQTSQEPSSKNEAVECHKCPQCFRTFTNAAILKVHLNSHA